MSTTTIKYLLKVNLELFKAFSLFSITNCNFLLDPPEFKQFAQEVKKTVKSDFFRVDMDGDDFVDAEEIQAYIAKWLEQDWEGLDTQVQFALMLVWKFIDVNGDDKISLAGN